jgi:protein-S-isoprenylcysteine O-methyltransferase Ste14
LRTPHLFTWIYFAGMVAELIIRAPYDRLRRKIPKIDQRVDSVEAVVLGSLFPSIFGLPMLFGLTRWLDFANYRLPPLAKTAMGGVGTVLLGLAVWTFWRAHHDLGSNWSPSLEINTEQTLVTRGVYGRVRHPMYASAAIWACAQALLLPNWLAGSGGIVGYLPLVVLRVPREERMMREHFGEAYRAYAARTRAVIPGLF